MKGTRSAFVCLLLLFCFSEIRAGEKFAGISYLSPRPGARWIRPETNIIVRSESVLDGRPLDPSLLTVEGSASGNHDGRLILSSDRRTVVFRPDLPFLPGERVTVRVSPLLTSRTGPTASSFQFEIASKILQNDPQESMQRAINDAQLNLGPLPKGNGASTSGSVLSVQKGSDDLPIDFPVLNVTKMEGTATGRLFIANAVPSGSSYLIIAENSARPFFYKKTLARGLDFKLQRNGLLTYYDTGQNIFYALNNYYDIVDSFQCGNGYSTDGHDLQILPNNHGLMMSYDQQVVDMSAIVPGGNPEARVTGLIIQELDENKDVVFQWRSWDHFDIRDATHENLTARTIDYVHGNSIEIDQDGNLLISSRHMDEVTKISRETGEIIWRWGGKNNEFTFVNDSLGFSHQHDVRRLPNGNITMFDNGNFHTPSFSRALEYRLDEDRKIAELVWEYRDSPDLYGAATGSVQRLENGNTLIGWGTAGVITEVQPDGSKVYELRLGTGIWTYRAFRFNWQPDILLSPLEQPAQYALLTNYPNPFNPTTLIKISLPEETNVSLKVYDLLGHEIANLFEGRQRAGVYIARFDASANLASGVYFYRLQTDRFTETKKMLLIK
jgi:hypothetical protein